MASTAAGYSERKSMALVWLGTAAVSGGVLLHLPGFVQAGSMHYHMAHMPMDPAMLFGMFLILIGLPIAGFGLLPPKPVARSEQFEVRVDPGTGEHLSSLHWLLMAALTVGLVIDTMKPATLGFVIPGMSREYGLPTGIVALFPLSALTGTVIGSLLWGHLADLYGRRASILLSALLFAATSICGFMPSFAWNVFMCFLMGCSAGGMIPVCYALLAETMPAKQRGWITVLVGGLGTLGGFLVASWLSSILQPVFSWRIMWFLGLPTGLFLIVLNRFVPESPKFLLLHGRAEEAAKVMRRFGATVHVHEVPVTEPVVFPQASLSLLRTAKYFGITAALALTGVGWGLLNFGLLLWLPASLAAKGYDVALTSALLAQSTIIALPTMLLIALAYNWWSTKWSLVTALGVSAVGLMGMLQLDTGLMGAFRNPVPFLALLVVGINGIIATILPYAAENYPLGIRGRATGIVAASTKLGGLAAQLVTLAGFFPSLGLASIVLMFATGASMALIVWFGTETRGVVLRDVRDHDAAWG